MNIPIVKLNENDILYFLHIPKTAGTTVIAVFDSFFDFHSIYPEQILHKLLLNFPKDFGNYRFIRGHFGYGLQEVVKRKMKIVTMLRDPLERTISFYDHMKIEPIRNNWVSPNFLSNDTLSSLMDNPRKKLVFSNNQTRHIAVDLDFEDLLLLDNKSKEKSYLEEIPQFVAQNISGDKLVEIAKKRLSQFAFFGLVERFEESMFLLFYTFGWNPIGLDWNLMVAPNKTKKESLDFKTMEKIKDICKLDYELYHHAETLFDERFSHMVDCLKEKYYESRLENLPFREMILTLLEKHYEDHFVDFYEERMESIDFDFSKKISGTGWFQRETANKVFFRWTGPTIKSTIDFPLSSENDLKIQLRVIGQASSDIPENLNIFINDIPLETRILIQNVKNPVYDGVAPRVLEAIVSKELLQSGKPFSRVTLMVNHTLNLKSLNPLYDNREVGIALDKIIIVPTTQSKYEKDTKDTISEYYIQYLGRKPDFDGLEYYFSQIINRKIKLENIPDILTNSTEFKQTKLKK